MSARICSIITSLLTAIFMAPATLGAAEVEFQQSATVHQPMLHREAVWRKVQEKANDTVVQLFVQSSIFNWLQPFKSPGHKKTFGTGFFIDAQGHIISNFHVVDQACGIKIQIPSFGKEQFDVEVVGVCPNRDLALLKLTDEAATKIRARLGSIPFLKLGDSDQVVRTQEILAMGYPLSQEKLKSTQGIVSGRENVGGESYIQITAPLNRGNSGGPSFNPQGAVIGINTARMASAQNIGYIIPINDVKNVINNLYQTKVLNWPTLGCEFNYGTTHMLQFLKSTTPGGMYISRVHYQTLLEQAGVREGDMIRSINGHHLDLYGEVNVEWSEDKVPVVALLNRFELGQNIEMEIVRDGVMRTVQFTFDNVGPTAVRRYYLPYESIDFEILGGMVVMPLTLNHLEKIDEPKSRAAKNLLKYEKREKQDKPRLFISYIFPTSQAQDARSVEPGDIITEVNGKTVFTLDEFRASLVKSVTDPALQGFVTFKTKDKKFMVLSLDRALRDEERLSKSYVYKKTKLTKQLMAQS